MARHYFHLTNGDDLIVDREGASTRSRADVWLRARKLSDALMDGLPDYSAWSDWLVCVHDARGHQVTIMPVLGPEGALRSPCHGVRPGRHRWGAAEAAHVHL
jgi:hypothetical protein